MIGKGKSFIPAAILLVIPLLAPVACSKKGEKEHAAAGKSIEKRNKLFKDLSRRQRKMANTFLDKGESFYFKEQYPEAREQFEKLWESGVQYGALAYRISYCYRMELNLTKSTEWLDKAQEMLALELAHSPDIETYYYLISTHYSKANNEKVSTLGKEAIIAFEQGEFGSDPSADEYFQMGRIYRYKNNQYKEYELQTKAVEKYTKAGVSDSIYFKLCLEEASKQVLTYKNYEQAATIFETMLKNDPKAPGATYSLGFAQFALGDYEKAIETWRLTKINDRKNFNIANYNSTVAKKLLQYSTEFGKDYALEDLSGTSNKQLKKDLKKVAGELALLKQKKVKAEKEGKALNDDELREYKTQDYRFNHYLEELIKRNVNLRDLTHELGLIGLVFR